MKYVFPCVLEFEEGYGYSVNFPDVSGAITQGGDLYDAILMAEDALAGILMSEEDDKREIPQPTPLTEIKLTGKEFVTLIKADTDAYRKMLAEMKAKESAEKSKGAA